MANYLGEGTVPELRVLQMGVTACVRAVCRRKFTIGRWSAEPTLVGLA